MAATCEALYERASPEWDEVSGVWKAEPWYLAGHRTPVALAAPYQPHVFLSRLKVVGGGGSVPEHDATIILGHGGSNNGQWVFDDGRSVIDVVEDYNDNNTSPIRFAAVCNADTETTIPDVVHPVNSIVDFNAVWSPNKTVFIASFQEPLETVLHCPEGWLDSMLALA